MAGRVTSYTGRVAGRQRIAYAGLLFSVLALAGCSSMGGLGDVTGSITVPSATGPDPSLSAPRRTGPGAAGKAAEPEAAPAAPSDWEAVKRSVAKAPADRPAKAPEAKIAWSNAETGNSGTISDVIASNRAGSACKGFNTTVSSMDGVRLYRGEVCRTGRTWELVTVEPADSGRL